ncbi:hypothetical protein MtrunA17_Chr8g0366861 [Medicago truncatula]|uniref:Uncharacterized protein n=1 Tax=Medicago truncatula TaxID=3880 RepID=A0A396GK71_MEDTR|nr:hypothetical protein MtrunA17_Chr8g0366861 [Medicago truncatula]
MSNLGFAIRSRRIAISQIYTKLSPLAFVVMFLWNIWQLALASFSQGDKRN